MDRLPSDNRLDSIEFIQKTLLPSQALHIAPVLIAKSLINENNLSFLSDQCKHVSHPWNDSCLQSAIILFLGSFRKNLNVYGSLYLISALLRGRPIKYYLTRLPNEVIRSSLFLAANCFYFLGFFCLARKFFGGVSYYGTLLANIPACFLSIIIERKQRRGLLALYLTNLATETAFNMLVYRKKLSTIPNGEVLIFALTSAVYALLFKMFIGSSEVDTAENHQIKLNRQSRVVKYYGFATIYLNNIMTVFNNLITGRHHRSHSTFFAILKSVELKLEHFLNSFNKSKKYKHRLCMHRYNCITYPVMGFIQRFIVGYLLQFAIKCFGSLGKIFKNPKYLIKLFKSPVNKQLGMFLGGYVFIFRLVSCLLRHLTNSNGNSHSLLAGFFSGWSMVFYKSSSIALYLNFKLYEILWMIGVQTKTLPLVRSFDVILYTFSTAFVLWAALMEPHNIRPAYWRFLVNVSDTKFQLVNRFPLDKFGTHASTIDRMIDLKYLF